MTAVDRIRAKINQRVQRHRDLGCPTYSRFLYVKRSTTNMQTFTESSTFELIEPNPKIINVPTRMIGMPLTDGSILLSADDFIVSFLNRDYPVSFFTARDINQFVIADEEGTPPTGIRCKRLHILQDRQLTLTLYLRQLHDKDRT